jgi:hypothetical protein
MTEPPAEHTVVEAEPAQRVLSGETATRSETPERRGYRGRFAVVYVALAVVAGTAVGAFAVLVASPDAGPAPAWSAWQPTGSDDAKAKQIADHVAKGYRVAGGQQLAAALVGPAQVSGNTETGDIPVRAIAIRPDTSAGLAEEGDIQIVDAGSNLMVVLCGLGANCSIGSGQPSEERHTLLRREALELALYSLKYVDEVNSITVFLPPNPDGTTAPTAIFLRRGDVAGELSKPLGETLGSKAPLVGAMTAAELAAVDRTTSARLFQYEYQQAQDGSAVLVLSPITDTA